MMKKVKFLSLAFIVVLLACGANTETDAEAEKEDLCANSDIDNFDSFLGIKYGTNELKLKGILGEFTGGEYTVDSSAFIYYFKRVENAPISIWVNGATGNVETIFMEILGYADVFDKDVADAVKEFKMDDCDSRFFGMTYAELTKTMGKPTSEETIEDGVKSLTYDSKDFKTAVNFKIYPSQGDKCSSISVNWFY